MKKIVVVIAPHPDDETLGCGGVLLKHKADGDILHWIIVTHINEQMGFPAERVASRNAEIEEVARRYGFKGVHQLSRPTTRLDEIPLTELINQFSTIFTSITPEVIYLPYRGDIHSDHAVSFDAAVSCTKWFRYPSVKRVLAYETLSETDFSIDPDASGFRPNVFVNITEHLEKKIEIAKIYASELAPFPFPRSEEALRALAVIRGVASGFKAAEAFMLLKEINS